MTKTPVKVANTRIFARRDGPLQILAYSMQLSVEAPVAMILPLPVTGTAGEDAVQFVNLDSCPAFFEELEAVFNPPSFSAARSAMTQASAKLQVHSVGQFEASYAPAVADLARLDPRFRLPGDVWRDLPDYADYGFAVFKLKPGARQKIHPMAFGFPTRDPARLFFPTVHVHDGRAHKVAMFDHVLYYQRDWPELREWVEAEPVYVEKPRSYDDTVSAMREQGRAYGRWSNRRQALEDVLGHRFSWRPARQSLGRWSQIYGVIHEDPNILRAMKDLVRADWHLYRRAIQGEAPNEDTWIPDTGVVGHSGSLSSAS